MHGFSQPLEPVVKIEYQRRRVHGCGGSSASLLPCRNATTIFLPIFYLKKNFILQNINQSKNIYYI
jgi:hypothetical protein